MRRVYQQLGAPVRFEWGPVGAEVLSPGCACLVVVDVLSFTTAVSVAVAKGMTVYPYRWDDESAKRFAAANDAVLAVGRSHMRDDHPWSLSPSALLAAPPTPRLVLPSPNGSTIAGAAQGLVVSASLRNAAAVAGSLLDAGLGTNDRPIGVVAAGERWATNQSLRPGAEDLLGAGAVLSRLRKGGLNLSIEGQLAAVAYESVDDFAIALAETSSGRELIADGYAADVEVAAACDVDDVVPALMGHAFQPSNLDSLRRLAEGHR